MTYLSNKFQKVTIALTHITTLAGLISMTVWCAKYLGFSLQEKEEFAWHPFLMYFGFMFCFGHSALAYRTFPFSRKVNKYIHFGLQTLGIVSISLGLAVIFFYHNENGFGNLASPHSWLGIGVFGLFCLQYLGSVLSLLFPLVSAEKRMKILPWHVALGCWLYMAAAAVCLMGIQEQSGFYEEADSCDNGSAICKWGNTVSVFILAGTLFIFLSLQNFNRPVPYGAYEKFDEEESIEED